MSTTDSSSRIIQIRNSSLLPNKIHSSKIPKSRASPNDLLGFNTKTRINRDKPYVDDLSCRHQPPLVLPRRGDADYFAFCQRLGDAGCSMLLIIY